MSNQSPDDRTLPRYNTDQLGQVVSLLSDSAHPTTIGSYTVISVLGQGGMGIVYKAEQASPIRRIVAIKIIKRGMDTDLFVKRFQRERQALAMMSHPNVAQVYDAGSTEAGRPYLVMEYVDGEPITAYCDRNRFDTRQRLELFIQACDGVQHAHQKAIVHRDLKPSNLLVSTVDGKPRVKVIDFGIAKALRAERSAATLFTEVGLLIGTPEYMSPEQAEPGKNASDGTTEDIDTRTDIYSLGVVLYELLAGALPFDAKALRGGAFDEIRRIIREVDPPRPSTRLTALGDAATVIAERRCTEVSALGRVLRNELEWIPLKAMRKNRAERYSAAAELAEDVRAYLDNRPLRAAPESTAYVIFKFVRRNKGVVSAVAAIVGVVLVGLVAVTWLAVRATRAEHRALTEKREADAQREHAEASAADLRAVNRFLTDDLLMSASPDVARGREISVREAVDRAADAVGERFHEQPLIEASVRGTLSEIYSALGQHKVALIHAQTAREIQQRLLGPDHRDTLAAAHSVAIDLRDLNRLAESESLLRTTMAQSSRALGADDEVTLACTGALAGVLRQQGRNDEAGPLYQRALEATRRTTGPESSETAACLNNYGLFLRNLDRWAEAEALYREALDLTGKTLGRDHPVYFARLCNMASLLDGEGKSAEAEAMQRQALSERRRVLGDDHPDTLLTMHNLAYYVAKQNRLSESEALNREALERRRRVLGEEHPDTLQSCSNLGEVMRLEGKYEEAIPFLREAVEKRRKVFGGSHMNTVVTTSSLANCYEQTGRLAEARDLLVLLAEPQSLGHFTPDQQARLLSRLGVTQFKLGEIAEAEPSLEGAVHRLRETGQQRHEAMIAAVGALADLYDRSGRADAAVQLRSELSALSASTAPTSRPATTPQRASGQ